MMSSHVTMMFMYETLYYMYDVTCHNMYYYEEFYKAQPLSNVMLINVRMFMHACYLELNVKDMWGCVDRMV